MEYATRLDYDNTVSQMAKAVDYDPKNSEFWNGYGFYLHIMARYDETIGALEQALAIDQKFLGENHPNV